MTIQNAIDTAISALPAIAAVAETFDPKIAGYVAVGEAIISAGKAFEAHKAVDPDAWAAQAAAFNAGAQDIAQAEIGN